MPMLRFFMSVALLPAVLLAHLYHHCEDVVPGLLLVQHCIGKHAAVPANVAEALDRVAALVPEPVAGVLGDVELATGIGREAMTTSFVMRAGAVHGCVALRDMEI